MDRKMTPEINLCNSYSSAAPPVTFGYIPEEALHRNVVEQDNLFLCCEVSRADATTQWYKDGVEIQTSNKVIIETEHTMRKLIIQSVRMSDTGTYTCRAGGSALIFKVNVRGMCITFNIFDLQQKMIPITLYCIYTYTHIYAYIHGFKLGQNLRK